MSHVHGGEWPKMTAREYLEARGWLTTGTPNMLLDPQHVGRVPDREVEEVSMPVDVALMVQRARDAIDERAAWVQFAAARLSIGEAHPEFRGSDMAALSVATAASHADDMLARYRARFAVEIIPDSAPVAVSS